MGSFHQSKRSDNKRHTVEVRWGLFFFENLTYFLFLRAVVNMPIQTLIILSWLLVRKMIISQLELGPPVGLPANFRDAVVLPRSRTNFCQAWNLTSVNLHAMIWRKMSIKKTWYLFLVGVPAEIISQMRGNQKVKMEDSYFGMLHNDPYSEYNYYGSQVYVPAAFSGPSIVQFISAKVIDSAFFWSLYFYVSYRWHLLCLVDPKILRTLR